MQMKISYSKQAAKFLMKPPAQVQRRIITAIQSLPAGDVKKLKGVESYRLRVGSFRIIFNKEGEVILIGKIDNRGEVYK